LPEQTPEQIGVLLPVPEQTILFGVLLGCILQRRLRVRVWGVSPLRGPCLLLYQSTDDTAWCGTTLRRRGRPPTTSARATPDSTVRGDTAYPGKMRTGHTVAHRMSQQWRKTVHGVNAATAVANG